MKIVKLLNSLVLLCLSFASYSQKVTFYMDTLTVERGSQKIEFNRNNCPVHLYSNETSKSVCLGLLGTDSVHIYLKQGLISFNSKPVPVFLYTFIIKDKNNSVIETIENHYLHNYPKNFSVYRISFNVFKLHFRLKADSTTYKLLPQTNDYHKNKYQIIHQLEDISIGKKTYKNTDLVISGDMENNIPTEKITICTYKKKPIYYTMSVHPINSFPDIKIICLNFSNNSSSQLETFIMKGNEAIAEEYTCGRSFHFITNPKLKKFKVLNAKPKYIVTQKE